MTWIRRFPPEDTTILVTIIAYREDTKEIAPSTAIHVDRDLVCMHTFPQRHIRELTLSADRLWRSSKRSWSH